MRNVAEMLLLSIFILLFFYRQNFIFLRQKTFGNLFLQLLLSICYLFERFKSLNDKFSSDWIRQLAQK